MIDDQLIGVIEQARTRDTAWFMLPFIGLVARVAGLFGLFHA
ncbi:MAG: hypothetical protein ACR2P6_11220 [Gammaproteobacteria bacterium]